MDEIEGEIKNVTSADPICIPTPASHPIHTFAPFLLFFLLPPRRVGLLSKQKAESWLLLRLSLPYECIDGFGKPPSVKPLHCILLHLLSPTSPLLLSFAGLILSASGLLLLILDVKVVLSSKKRKKERKEQKRKWQWQKIILLERWFLSELCYCHFIKNPCNLQKTWQLQCTSFLWTLVYRSFDSKSLRISFC